MKVRASVKAMCRDCKVIKRQGKVQLKLKDGRELDIHVKAVRGTADNPMTRAEVDEKAYHLMVPILGAKRSRALTSSRQAARSQSSARGRAAIAPIRHSRRCAEIGLLERAGRREDQPR